MKEREQKRRMDLGPHVLLLLHWSLLPHTCWIMRLEERVASCVYWLIAARGPAPGLEQWHVLISSAHQLVYCKLTPLTHLHLCSMWSRRIPDTSTDQITSHSVLDASRTHVNARRTWGYLCSVMFVTRWRISVIRRRIGDIEVKRQQEPIPFLSSSKHIALLSGDSPPVGPHAVQ